MSESPIASRRNVVAALLVLTLLSGVVHGYLDGRWSVSEEKSAIGMRLTELPESFGEWSLVKAGDLNEDAREMLRCYGSFLNVYQHQPTGSLVNVAVMYGPRGPIAVHTPEVCYDSSGTKQTRERVVESLDLGDVDHQFWSVEFMRKNDPSERFEVWYAWSTGDEWIAADNPRFWFTEDLYKIQLSGPSVDSSFSPCKSLLTALLPQLEQQLQ